MENINTVCVTGNLTADSVCKNSVLRFSVAVNERRKDGEDWVDFPNFFNCVMFGARAEALEEYLKKGNKVSICGRLRQNRWEDEDGNNRSAVEIVVNNIELMQRPKDDDKPTKKSSNKNRR